MKIAKNISLGIVMQMLVTLMHLIIHFMNSSFEQDIQITCSFIAVILVTYITTLYFDLPIYAIFCGQIITLLFVLIFENEGVYLLYYLHKGSSTAVHNIEAFAIYDIKKALIKSHSKPLGVI